MALKLDKLTVEELNDVIVQAQRRKQEAYEERKQQVRGRIDAILAESSFTLEDLYGSRGGRKPAKRGLVGKSKKPPMFLNPDNPEETWSGFGGRKPRWFINAINRGLSQEDLMIGSAPKSPSAVKRLHSGAKSARGRGAPETAKATKRR